MPKITNPSQTDSPWVVTLWVATFNRYNYVQVIHWHLCSIIIYTDPNFYASSNRDHAKEILKSQTTADRIVSNNGHGIWQ